MRSEDGSRRDGQGRGVGGGVAAAWRGAGADPVSASEPDSPAARNHARSACLFRNVAVVRAFHDSTSTSRRSPSSRPESLAITTVRE